MAHPASDLEQRLKGTATRGWVAFGAGGPLLRDKEIRRDRTLDGCYVLHTNSPGSDLDLAIAYLRFQRLARDAVLRAALLPPALHSLIWPAMVLVYEAEQRTTRPWIGIVSRLADVHQVTFRDGASRTTRLDDDQQTLLRSCGVRLP